MKTVRVTMDEALLAQLDRQPEVRDRGRSAVLCEAVAEYLARHAAHPEPPAEERIPLGRWLVENAPRGTNLPIPDRYEDPERPIPFIDYATEDDECAAAGAWGHDVEGAAQCRMQT